MKIENQPVHPASMNTSVLSDNGAAMPVTVPPPAIQEGGDLAQILTDTASRIQASADGGAFVISPELLTTLGKSGVQLPGGITPDQIAAQLNGIPKDSASLTEILGDKLRGAVHYSLTELDALRKVFDTFIQDLGGSKEVANKAVEILLKHVVIDPKTGGLNLSDTSVVGTFLTELDNEVFAKIPVINDLLSIDKQGDFRKGLFGTLMKVLDSALGNNDTQRLFKTLFPLNDEQAEKLEGVFTVGNLYLLASGLLEGALLEGDFPPQPNPIPHPNPPSFFLEADVFGLKVPVPNPLFGAQSIAHAATCWVIDAQNAAAFVQWEVQCAEVRAKKMTGLMEKLGKFQATMQNALVKQTPMVGEDGRPLVDKNGKPLMKKVSIFEKAATDFKVRNANNSKLMEGISQDAEQLNVKRAEVQSLLSRFLKVLEALRKNPLDEGARNESQQLFRDMEKGRQELNALLKDIEKKANSMDTKNGVKLPPELQALEDAIVGLSLLSLDPKGLSKGVVNCLKRITDEVRSQADNGMRVGFNALSNAARTQMLQAIQEAASEKDIEAIANTMRFFNGAWGKRIEESKSLLLASSPEERKQAFASLEWRNL